MKSVFMITETQISALQEALKIIHRFCLPISLAHRQPET